MRVLEFKVRVPGFKVRVPGFKARELGHDAFVLLAYVFKVQGFSIQG